MTTQLPEILSFASRSTWFYEEVLRNRLVGGAINELLARPQQTALMRGYVGSWRIRARRLYLCSVSGNAGLTMTSLFPGCSGEVPADWYNGVITLPYGGRLIDQRSFGRGFAYASYLVIEFSAGKVIRTSIDTGEPKCPSAELPAWLRESVERRLRATVAPSPPPTTTGEHMPAQVIEALLNGVPALRAWRCYLGMSESELAALTGINSSVLADCETHGADRAVLSRLAVALGLTLDDLEYA